jgi:phage terminase small subunit
MARKKYARVTDKHSGLTHRQERFAQEYTLDLNSRDAAVRAGYSATHTAKVAGCENLRNPKVNARIEEIMQKRAKKLDISAELVLGEIKKIALADIRELYDDKGKLLPIKALPKHIAQVVASFDVYKDFTEGVEVGETKKVKLYDKIKALELLGRHLKLFTDRVEHSGTIGLAERLEKARARR